MKTAQLAAFLAEFTSTPYQAGYQFGMVVPILLSGGGAIWCGAILSRPNVNRKGVGALLTVFVGWTLALILTLARKAVSGGTGFAFGIGGIVAVTVIAAVSLAIASFMDEGDYVQGRGQGIAALAFSGIMGLVLVFGISQGITKAAQGLAATAASNGQAIERDSERYRIKALPRPWVETNAKKLNALASMGLMRTRPEAYFIVIAETLPPGSTLELDSYSAAVQSNLLNGSPDAKVLSQAPETLNGKDGLRLLCTGRFSGIDFVYRYWLHVSDGIAYQVVSWSQGKETAALLTQTEPVFSALEILPRKH